MASRVTILAAVSFAVIAVGLTGGPCGCPCGCRRNVSDVTIASENGGADDSDPGDAGDLWECAAEQDFDPSSCPAEAVEPCVIYVDLSALEDGAGTTWDLAFRSVQQGIDRAYCAVLGGVRTCQVWVRKGVYPVNRGCRSDTFRLRPGVELYGGFRGGEQALAERDWIVNQTILKGDGPASEKANTVVTGADESVLDGIVVEGGSFRRPVSAGGSCGAGLFVDGAKMVVRHAVFRDNHSQSHGGGVCILGSTVIIEDSVFAENTAVSGGALYAEGSKLKITGSTFESNVATGSGAVISSLLAQENLEISRCSFLHNDAHENAGAVRNERGGLIVEKSFFSWNRATRSGGGLWHSVGDLVIRDSFFGENTCASGEGGGVFSHLADSFSSINTVYWRNSAGGRGGALMHREGQPIGIVNSTFVGNRSLASGGAVSLDFLSGLSEIVNSILWDNTTPSITENGGTLYKAGHNYIDDGPDAGPDGGGEPPGFRDPDAGDLQLLSRSPCIDRASGQRAPATDFLGHPRVDDPQTPNRGTGPVPYVDIGAFEYQLETH